MRGAARGKQIRQGLEVYATQVYATLNTERLNVLHQVTQQVQNQDDNPGRFNPIMCLSIITWFMPQMVLDEEGIS